MELYLHTAKKIIFLQLQNGDYQSLSQEDLTKFDNVYGMLQSDPDNLLQNYLDTHMPGFRYNDPLPQISTLLAARDPGTYLSLFIMHIHKNYKLN